MSKNYQMTQYASSYVTTKTVLRILGAVDLVDPQKGDTLKSNKFAAQALKLIDQVMAEERR
jgi:hypothetical protein